MQPKPTKPSLTATFTVDAWNEAPVPGEDGALKLTSAQARYTYRAGDAKVGTGAVHYLMSYQSDGDATFVGLERFTGTVLGRAGSFVLQHQGRYHGARQESRARLTVVPHTATGELTGLEGEGEAVAIHGGAMELALNLRLPGQG